MDARDIELSRRMRGLAEKIEALVTRELGAPHLIGLVIQPWSCDGSCEAAEFQYISNAPRYFMHGAMRKLVEKWDSGAPDIASHNKQ
jgi:hypothetical protein